MQEIDIRLQHGVAAGRLLEGEDRRFGIGDRCVVHIDRDQHVQRHAGHAQAALEEAAIHLGADEFLAIDHLAFRLRLAAVVEGGAQAIAWLVQQAHLAVRDPQQEDRADGRVQMVIDLRRRVPGDRRTEPRRHLPQAEAADDGIFVQVGHAIGRP